MEINQKANHVIRTASVNNFKELTKVLLTIQNDWKGKILSIKDKGKNSCGYEIIFRTAKANNILCRIVPTDKYGWKIPVKFRKNYKERKEMISAVKECVAERCGKDAVKELTDDQIMHVVYDMVRDLRAKPYRNGMYEFNGDLVPSAELYSNLAHTALIYAKDKNGKQIIFY